MKLHVGLRAPHSKLDGALGAVAAPTTTAVEVLRADAKGLDCHGMLCLHQLRPFVNFVAACSRCRIAGRVCDNVMMDLSGLRADEFESLCYDLLEHLGLRNLEWRRGQNAGCSASDAGRDIEGDLFRVDIDSAVVAEKWFVECKHWKTAVPPNAIDGLFTWANAERPDVAVVVSSGALSNPAHDWVKAYRRNNKPPYSIKTWEQKPLAELLSSFPDILLAHGITSSYTSPPLLALWRDLKIHSLEHLFALLDSLCPDERDKMLGMLIYNSVLLLRARRSETGKEAIRDLLLDPADYDKFKQRCHELVDHQDVNPSFLAHAIAAAASRWLAFRADPFESDQAIKRSMFAIDGFEADVTRLEAGESIALSRRGASREDQIAALRKCADDLRANIAGAADSIAKSKEILERWERSVVIPFLSEDQLHIIDDFLRQLTDDR